MYIQITGMNFNDFSSVSGQFIMLIVRFSFKFKLLKSNSENMCRFMKEIMVNYKLIIISIKYL